MQSQRQLKRQQDDCEDDVKNDRVKRVRDDVKENQEAWCIVVVTR